MISRSQISAFSLLLFAIASTASAFNPQPEPPGFGMVGIISSQTARLNVSYAAPPDPERAVPPGPCRGTLLLQFLDARGGVVAQRSVAITAGMTESLDVAGGPRGTAPGSLVPDALRTQVRASVSWTEYPPGPCRGGALFGTVEVINNTTGETSFVLPGTLGAFQEVDNRK